MRHINIPLFVPHEGCPQQCSFCNQRTITGAKQAMTPERAMDEIETLLSSIEESDEVEIAFFGGSFTAIERNKMVALLRAAQPYIDSGRVSSIRISTRPDAIDHEILDILSKYRVKTIELGIQSMSDRVLNACRRGHSAADSASACKLIAERGFTLGGQMMIGLPEATIEDEMATARAITALGAKEARIYPTVVFRDTELYAQTQSGAYKPLELDEAIERTASVLEIFERAGVKLLRIGLCESEGLHDGSIVGGAFHPAMGELCQSALYRRSFSDALTKRPDLIGKPIVIGIAPGRLSAAIGQKKCNVKALKAAFSMPSIRFTENRRFSGYEFEITAESEQLCD